MYTALTIYLVIGCIVALYYRWVYRIPLHWMILNVFLWLPVWFYILIVSYADDYRYDPD